MRGMTPVPLSKPGGQPVFPMLRISRDSDLKQQVLSVLMAHGVTCDRILEIMDQVKSNPDALHRWFQVH